MSFLPSRALGAVAGATLAAVVVLADQALAAPTLEALGNIAYPGIYEEPVRLVNGVYEGEPFVAGGSARPRVELLADLYLTPDIDGDGSEDAFVLLNESSGGTGQFLYLAAVTRVEDGVRHAGTLRVGDRVDLAGPPWRLTGFDWHEPASEGVAFTARLEGDRLSGSAGCNNYCAMLEAPTPYELAIGPVGATRMACPPAQMDAENRFLGALQTATQFSFVLGKLVITYQRDDSYPVLVFQREP